MSWYYNYYICYKNNEDGKLYPLGPFDYKGQYFDVLSKSRSFASSLHEKFINISTSESRKKLISEKLLNAIHESIDEEDKAEFYDGKGYYCWSYLPYKDLPKEEYIKEGYCLISDIEQFKSSDYFDGFYEWLTPEIYAKKLENELKFGPPKPSKDEEGYEYTPHSMSEYSFYRWADYESEGYEVHIIRDAVRTLRWDIDFDDPKDDIYIVLTQG